MAPLHLAAQKGRYGLVEMGHLVVERADINIKDNSGVKNYIWILVAKHCNYCFISLNQRTPLHIAVREGQEYTVKSLVENGADVNSKDKDGVSGMG